MACVASSRSPSKPNCSSQYRALSIASAAILAVAASKETVAKGAGLAADIAKGDGKPRVYIVEPMGVFEKPPFDRGTVALAKAVAESGAARGPSANQQMLWTLLGVAARAASYP